MRQETIDNSASCIRRQVKNELRPMSSTLIPIQMELVSVIGLSESTAALLMTQVDTLRVWWLL